jgi:hypothetical protein
VSWKSVDRFKSWYAASHKQIRRHIGYTYIHTHTYIYICIRTYIHKHSKHSDFTSLLPFLFWSTNFRFQKQASFLCFSPASKPVSTFNHVAQKLKTSRLCCVRCDCKRSITSFGRPIFSTMATRSLPVLSEVDVTFLATQNARCSNVVPLAKINFVRQLVEPTGVVSVTGMKTVVLYMPTSLLLILSAYSVEFLRDRSATDKSWRHTAVII